MDLSFNKTEINRKDLSEIKSYLRKESDFKSIYGNYDFSKVNEIVKYIKDIEQSDMRSITFTDPKAVKSWKGS